MAQAGAFGVSPDQALAIRKLEARVRRSPENPVWVARRADAWLALAQQTQEHEELARAEEAQRAVIALLPDDTASWAALARVQLSRNRCAASLESARRAAALSPGRRDLRAAVGDAHFALGNYVEAEAIYHDLAAEARDLAALGRVGQVHELRGRDDLAVATWEQALALGEQADAPPAEQAWCHLLLAEHLRLRGHGEPARAHYERALALDPVAEAAERGLAEIELATGSIGAAEARLRALAERRPRPATWLLLARVLEREGQEAEARAWLDRTREDFAGDLRKGELGHLRDQAGLALDDGDADAAVDLARRDLAEVRHDLQTLETLAWTLHRAGRSREALPHLRRALQTGSRGPQLRRRAAEMDGVAVARGAARAVVPVD
jgi:tetratricopeptide (TPR) repeat protein